MLTRSISLQEVWLPADRRLLIELVLLMFVLLALCGVLVIVQYALRLSEHYTGT